MLFHHGLSNNNLTCYFKHCLILRKKKGGPGGILPSPAPWVNSPMGQWHTGNTIRPGMQGLINLFECCNSSTKLMCLRSEFGKYKQTQASLGQQSQAWLATALTPRVFQDLICTAAAPHLTTFPALARRLVIQYLTGKNLILPPLWQESMSRSTE